MRLQLDEKLAQLLSELQCHEFGSLVRVAWGVLACGVLSLAVP